VLQVDLALVCLVLALGDEAPEKSQRDPVLGVVGIHVPQERRVGAGNAGNHGAQLLGHCGIAPGAAKIEEDIA
jgi:hypothetical protein